MFKNNLSVYFILFLFLFFGGCSQQAIDEINEVIDADFGGYTKSNPLKIYVSPFKSFPKWAESEIGKIAWQGAVDGVKDLAFFSDGKVVFVGSKTRGYHGLDEEEYYHALEMDDFGNARGNLLKNQLKHLANQRAANFIIYGIYDGDDSGLGLTIYFHSTVDDIFLKEPMEFQVQFMVVSNLIKGQQSGRRLTKAEEELQKMIHEKVKYSTTKMLRKYVERR